MKEKKIKEKRELDKIRKMEDVRGNTEKRKK